METLGLEYKPNNLQTIEKIMKAQEQTRIENWKKLPHIKGTDFLPYSVKRELKEFYHNAKEFMYEYNINPSVEPTITHHYEVVIQKRLPESVQLFLQLPKARRKEGALETRQLAQQIRLINQATIAMIEKFSQEDINEFQIHHNYLNTVLKEYNPDNKLELNQ